jgi:hypothetical protein
MAASHPHTTSNDKLPSPPSLEKGSVQQLDPQDVAQAGHTGAVDAYGRPALVVDPKVERSLLRKLDIRTLPPIFCASAWYICCRGTDALE